MNPTWKDVMLFNLPDNPIIFDVGGYNGDWTQVSLNYYNNPKIYIFEPVMEFYKKIVDRYKGYSNIKVYNFGLSDNNGIENIFINKDSSSLFKKTNNIKEIQLVNIIDFLKSEKIYHVDLIKINIEGEEYRLLEHLIKYPELNIFNNFLIQFHDFIENSKIRKDKITSELSKYYELIFDYPFVFEGWKIKKIKKINCFGDSHISIFSNRHDIIPTNTEVFNDSFIAYRFDSHLAYNIINKPHVLNMLKNANKGNEILICFGEIDCRAQIKKISETTNRTYDIVVDEIVERYFNFLEKLNRKDIIVFSITPELKEEPHWYYYKNNLESFDCPRGTLQERTIYKEYFNEKVKMMCSEMGYKFISIYDYVKGKSEYYLDDIHLAPNRVYYLIKREFIKNRLVEE